MTPMLIITIDTLEIGTFSGASEYLYQSGANEMLQRVLMKANNNNNVELMLYFEKWGWGKCFYWVLLLLVGWMY